MLTIEYAKDPFYNDANNETVFLTVKFEEFAEELPFCANSQDNTQYGRDLCANAKNGDYGTVKSWHENPHYTPPEPTADQNKVTAMDLLSATDWTSEAAVADPLVSNPYLINQSDFLSYRSAVREIAVNPVAGNIIWLLKPKEVWSV
jgi:hypothetical protein